MNCTYRMKSLQGVDYDTLAPRGIKEYFACQGGANSDVRTCADVKVAIPYNK